MENLHRMRKLAAVIAALGLIVPAAQAGTTPQVSEKPADADAVLFAGGGTLLTNGIFFPGTAIYQDGEYQGAPPMQVNRGTNITFVNLDPAPVTNIHKIRSDKTNRKGRPVFESEPSAGPGTITIETSHLKPGVYPYYCPVHSGMYGRIEIVG